MSSSSGRRNRVVACVLTALVAWSGSGLSAAERPNILWITCEDMSPNLGCFGDQYSHSPTLDRLAAEGVRFTNCFTHIGVCAPSRSGLITGMYPCSIGSQHMRSQTILPSYVKCFPEYLRSAGYYCTNNSKTDYNFPIPPGAWDESSGKAHWRNRPKDAPFFAVFNFTVTHESQIRAPQKAYERNTARLTPEQRHDPAKAPLPPYFPDTPIVRHDVAQYYDNITAMDYLVADALKELEEAGLADDTIVFFYSDHGAGMPRAKRWLYDSSLHVPLIVRWPEKLRSVATKSAELKPGTTRDELVAFVDLAPTVLSIAGVEIPKHLQGQAFLGAAQAAQPREYVYGCRDRMDERVDMIRSVRDKQFQYIRNYQWWKPYAQNINYMNEMPTMQEWRRLAAEGKLVGPQKNFLAPQKPREELYDCVADPHQVNNLAADPKYQDQLARLRAAHEQWTTDVRDLGYLPESVMQDIIHLLEDWREEPRLAETTKVLRHLQVSIEDVGDKHDIKLLSERIDQEIKNIGADAGPFRYLAFVIRLVDLAPNLDEGAALVDMLETNFKQSDNYNEPLLLSMRIAIAQAKVRAHHKKAEQLDQAILDAVRPALVDGLKCDNEYRRHEAVLVVDDLGAQAAEFLPEVEAMLKVDKGYAARVGEHIVRTRDGKKSNVKNSKQQ